MLYVVDAGFYCRIGKEITYCVFRQKGSIIIGRSCNIDHLYSGLNRNNVYLMYYIITILLLVIYSRRFIFYRVRRCRELELADGNTYADKLLRKKNRR